jgi:hypothetical protein
MYVENLPNDDTNFKEMVEDYNFYLNHLITQGIDDLLRIRNIVCTHVDLIRPIERHAYDDSIPGELKKALKNAREQIPNLISTGLDMITCLAFFNTVKSVDTLPSTAEKLAELLLVNIPSLMTVSKIMDTTHQGNIW